MKHYKTYRIRKQMIESRLAAGWRNLIFAGGGYKKVVLKNKDFCSRQDKAMAI